MVCGRSDSIKTGTARSYWPWWRYWVYEYLFAKSDRTNIDDDELAAFRTLAKAYERLKDRQVIALLNDEEWKEICNDHQAQAQE